MKKSRNECIKNLRYLCLGGIAVLGLISIVATGGGGGGGGGAPPAPPPGISYTGLTTPATIDENNAKDITTGAYQGGQTGVATGGLSAVQTVASEHIGHPRTLKVAQALEDSLRRVDFMSRSGGTFLGAVYTESDTVNGDCGGNGSYSISINDETGEFSGSFAYNDYCNGGVVLSGSTTFSGQVDVNTGYLLTFTFSFHNLTCTLGSDSFTLDGDISWDVTGSTATLAMTMLMQDNNTGKVYWVKDYTMTLTAGVDYVKFEISGYYYDPDYGYIAISTPEPFVIYDGYYWPSDGVLVVTGATGTAGGSTKAKLTVLSSTSYQVEADTDGDGSIDYVYSGVWGTGSPQTVIDWVFTQTIITREYSGGLLAVLTFYRNFVVTSGSGNVPITVTIKETPGSPETIDQETESFYVVEGNQYEIAVRVNVGGEGLCSPLDTDVVIFSSPSASSTEETYVYPTLRDNNFYCVKSYSIDEISLN